MKGKGGAARVSASDERSGGNLTTTRNQPSEEQEIFGPYLVYERLGVGGMATVHRAKEHGIEGFERIVALKRLLPHLADDASFVRSFVREAKLASMLQHANIVQLYELGRVGKVLFISMEHIEGRDVRKVLRQARKVAGPPPLPVFLSLMIQLCDALDYAHCRTDQSGEPLGLVHRDVSPSNLLITGTGHLKVIDFGIAKAQSTHLRTQTGRVKGKLAYMAPEALRVQEMDARSDVFSAGVIAHELLTARPLFACKNEYQTLLRVQRAEVQPPSLHNPNCPPELDELVLRALARDADDRWASAAEWRDALDDLRTRLGVSATNREVASWMEWAFATDGPPTGTFARIGSSTDNGTGRFSSRSLTPSESRTPLPLSRTPGIIPGVREAARVVSLSTELPPASRPAGVPDGESDGALDGPDGLDGEDAAVEFAWGGAEGEGKDASVALEDIPDVSMQMAAVARSGELPGDTADAVAGRAPDAQPVVSGVHGRARPESAPDAGIGAGFIETHRSRARRTLVIAACLAAVACAGVAFWVMSRQQPQAAAPAAPATGPATLRFAVEPAAAAIEVQGYGRHEGSPLVLDVEAPGVYEVKIHHEGYKSYVSTLEVTPNGTYVVQTALRPGGSDKASLAVRSSPPGQRVVIDDVATGAHTPSDHEIGPGAHVITIIDEEGNELWRHAFEAAANTHYEFHPALKQADEHRSSRDERRAERRRRRAAGEGDPAAAATAGEAVAQALAEPEPEPAKEPAKEPADPEPADPEPAPEPAKPAAAQASLEVPAPSTPSEMKALEATELPKVQTPARSRRSAAPVTIPPTRVRKVSGDLPIVSARKGTVPAQSSAKLCIDARGSVTSVEMLTKMPRRAERELQRAFRGWHYTPYVEGGRAAPACFAITFRVSIQD